MKIEEREREAAQSFSWLEGGSVLKEDIGQALPSCQSRVERRSVEGKCHEPASEMEAMCYLKISLNIISDMHGS
jgi:hypothetical protein